MVLPKGHQQVVDFGPVLPRQFYSQCLLGRVRVWCRNITPAIADTMDMSINTDAGLAESKGDHQVGGLAPHSLEFKHFVYFIRNDSTVILDQAAAYFVYLPGLISIEAGRIDQLFDLFDRYKLHVFGCIRTGKQPLRSHSSHLISGSQGYYAGYQNLKWAAAASGNNSDCRRSPCQVFLA